MQTKFSALALVLAASLAGAVPTSRIAFTARGESGSGSCANSGAFCCNSTIPASDADSSLTTFLGALGMGLENLANELGLGCTSMSGGASYSSNVLCCDDSALSGLIAIGCISS